MAVISISRQFGAGGKTLSEKLAERLGYESVDYELVSKVAKAADITIEDVEAADRKSSGKIKRFISGLVSTDFLRETAKGLSESELFALLNDIIPEIAGRDNVIFLGRGSQFILPDAPDNLKVLLIGNKKARVGFMVENYDMPLADAEKMVGEWDNNRGAFLKKYTSGDPNDVSNYDLVINTDSVKLDWAVEMICQLIDSRKSSLASES